MPFFGQDWRSPGDQWVRNSQGGWEQKRLWREKVFESLNENALARFNRLSQESLYQDRDIVAKRTPHILYCSRSSKERKELTSLSEAIIKLDFNGAVKDNTRGNYLAKLLKILLNRLPELSGSSQNLVLNLLEAMVLEALKTDINFSMVKGLLECASVSLNEGKVNHIGSKYLWLKHTDIVNDLSKAFSVHRIKERCADGKIMFSELPLDCLRLIFNQIPGHQDIINVGQASLMMNEVTEERILWKKLCLYHFSHQQLQKVLPEEDKMFDVDWKALYMKFHKRFSRKENYTDMLAICCNCCIIHWKERGHPCSFDNFKVKEIEPEDFLTLFKL